MSRAVVLLAVALAACGGEPGDRSVSVFAASSLTDVFTEIEAAFEAEHPDIDVRLNLSGSSALREQILQGAPADVLAAANETTVEALEDAGAIAGTPAVFAVNRLELAVPAGNPAGVEELSDLSRPELLVGLCATGVPCGDLARAVLARAGVVASVDTNEPNVRALTAKIAAAELDAGLVYTTDVAAVDGVTGIALPADLDIESSYVIATLAGAGPEAVAFVAFVLSPAGREILERGGFELP